VRVRMQMVTKRRRKKQEPERKTERIASLYILCSIGNAQKEKNAQLNPQLNVALPLSHYTHATHSTRGDCVWCMSFVVDKTSTAAAHLHLPFHGSPFFSRALSLSRSPFSCHDWQEQTITLFIFLSMFMVGWRTRDGGIPPQSIGPTRTIVCRPKISSYSPTHPSVYPRVAP